MKEEREIKVEDHGKKRGRRRKGEVYKYELNKEKVKFFVDLSKEEKELETVQQLLLQANNKAQGREITFKDIALYAIGRIGPKDVDKIQEFALTEMEKVERLMDDYNSKNGLNLTMGEFLIKKLNIN